MSAEVFLQRCDEMLLKLGNLIEIQDKNCALDVEYFDGILKITAEATLQTYIINRHAASQKIWYSSPLSGTDYFTFNQKSQKWLNHDAVELEEKLLGELKNFW
jgi:frataxin-like iron-binding protein CyaY